MRQLSGCEACVGLNRISRRASIHICATSSKDVRAATDATAMNTHRVRNERGKGGQRKGELRLKSSGSHKDGLEMLVKGKLRKML
jgi:hypothetical protein